MADATFRDLCLDASDAGALASFWATALDRAVTEAPGDGFQVLPSGRSKSSRIWVDPVSEARGAKTRVHLDVRLGDPDPSALLAAGATIAREPGAGSGWWVLADPEGNEFCAFPPKPEWGGPGPFELVVDCRDPLAQATWWAGRTGGRVGRREGASFAWVEGAEGFPYAYWVFAPVPEPKTVKNRMHWDVQLTMRDEPSALLEAGATLQRPPDDEIEWWVLADPEGNEFCAFAPGVD